MTRSDILPTPTSRFVEVNGLRLHLLDWGHRGAPALLLLHGGTAHAHWWDWFAPAMSERFHVLALDLRGHGDSAWARPPAYEIEDYVADVAALGDGLGRSRIVVIGHSLGGTIAAAAAARLGNRAAALVIVDSRTRAGNDGLRFLHRLSLLPHPRYPSRDQAIRQYRLLPTDSSARPDCVAHVAGHAFRQNEDQQWTLKFDRAALASIRSRDIRPELSRLRCPILVVRGGASRLMSAEAIAEMAVVAPQLEVVEIPDARHHVMLDRPDEFNRAVRGFLGMVTDDW
jgi:pimeloyl-ACP methyl ester carboxylesterase